MTMLVILNNNLNLKTSFLHLLSLLSIFDCLCIVCNIFLFSGPLLSEIYRHQVYPHLVPWLLPLAQTCLTGSVLTILVVAVERLTCVTR